MGDRGYRSGTGGIHHRSLRRVHAIPRGAVAEAVPDLVGRHRLRPRADRHGVADGRIDPVSRWKRCGHWGGHDRRSLVRGRDACGRHDG